MLKRYLFTLGITLFILTFLTDAHAAKTPEQQTQAILSTGMIYGQMAAENISQYLKSLANAQNITHGSNVIKKSVVQAIKKAEDALRQLDKSIESSNIALTSK